MLEKRHPIPVAEAIARIMKLKGQGKTEKIHIDKAYGRVLGEDLTAKHDVPPFDRSPYDGFAIRAEDTSGASSSQPVSLKVIEEIGAGSVASKVPGENEAIRIMTGAALPKGCDAVVMLELVQEKEENGQPYITVKRSFQPGTNLSYKGEDAKEGTVLAKKGERINPGVHALLATFGYEYLQAAVPPKVGIFATGTELLEPGDALEPGKIRNSNAHMLFAQVQRAGGEPVLLGKLPDHLETCYKAVKEASQQFDLLITTGGVSVGDFDYMPEVYEKLGAEVLFNKVAMRPGSVTTAAHKDNIVFYGLSGNPSACFTGFELFVRPVIQTRLFSEKPHLKKIQGRLSEDFAKPNPFTRFIRSKMSFEKDAVTVAPSGFNKSSAVSSLAASDCFIMLPGGTRGFQRGDLVDVLLHESSEGSQWHWN
ncbi:molybdopterin molybdotransferase MoeA [Metabacillus sp. GX 13764]|uniref:molybdopterin molybdotransferase MoeA n=1 Tax=Metabacillus kandeliae TaxID=2900151 RepID=UPI001E487F58|nr:gephyrin-like molybdotransferase Glp [Metabacillus kandeliae]MCD7033567.1 molybdopterin molybdotransferase MoeA [Metabacillus kandeliae]